MKRTLYLPLSLLLVAGHFTFLMLYFEPAISTPDAHSYFVQAKQLALTAKTYVALESVLQYVGPHWCETRPDRFYCTHPPGLPAILALFYRLFGPCAALMVNPLLSSLTLLGLYLLARLWISEGWALLAAGLMAVNPVANEHALFGFSHAAVAFFLVWGLFFLAQGLKAHSAWWALMAGFFFGFLPAIRYPEGVYLLAAGVFLVLSVFKHQASWRILAAFALGAALPLGALFIRNQAAYGAFWKTGYALTHEQSAFGLGYFLRNSPTYLRKMLGEGGAMTFGLGVMGLAFLCAHPNERSKSLLLTILIVPITVLYMSWYWTPDLQSMRFLLPTFYLYTIAAVWLLAFLVQDRPKRSAWACALTLLLLTLWWGLPQSHQRLISLKTRNRALANATGTIEREVEKGSLIIAPEGLCQHLDFLGSWRLISLPALRPQPFHEEAPSAGSSAPRGPQREAALQRRFGRLSGEDLFAAVTDEVWTWAGTERKVYLVANEGQIAGFEMNLPLTDTLVTLERIELTVGETQSARMSGGLGPPGEAEGESQGPPGPMGSPSDRFQGRPGPNQIFDLVLNGEPLWLVQWRRGTL
jgi:4-amino-4-deoxy-L-arabinose transferase-like glycosyltransferase